MKQCVTTVNTSEYILIKCSYISNLEKCKYYKCMNAMENITNLYVFIYIVNKMNNTYPIASCSQHGLVVCCRKINTWQYTLALCVCDPGTKLYWCCVIYKYTVKVPTMDFLCTSGRCPKIALLFAVLDKRALEICI